MSQKISFEWCKWMTLAAAAVLFFTLSYLMAATVPTCTDCRAGDPSAMQFFHYVSIFGFLCGCVGCTIGAFITWNDQ